MFHLKETVSNGRRFKRLRAIYPVKLQMPSFQEDAWVGNTHDLSASGFRSVTDRPFMEGSTVTVQLFVHPLDRVLDLTARVVRVRNLKGARGLFVVSLCFLEMSKMDQEALNEFIERTAAIPAARVRIDHASKTHRRRQPQTV